MDNKKVLLGQKVLLKQKVLLGQKEILRMVSNTYKHEFNILKASVITLATYYRHCRQYPLQEAKQGRECVIYDSKRNTAVIAIILSERLNDFERDKDVLHISTSITGMNIYYGEHHKGWFDTSGRMDKEGIHIITDLVGYLHDNNLTMAKMLGLNASDIQHIIKDI